MELDYNVSSGPFLSLTLEIEIGDGPGPELDNNLRHTDNKRLPLQVHSTVQGPDLGPEASPDK